MDFEAMLVFTTVLYLCAPSTQMRVNRPPSEVILLHPTQRHKGIHMIFNFFNFPLHKSKTPEHIKTTATARDCLQGHVLSELVEANYKSEN